MIVHCKYDELVAVENLVPYPRNHNQHTEEQIDRLAKLLKYQGIRAPIVVAAAPYGCIAKGHGTLEAIKRNGWPTAPIVFQNFESEEQLYAFVQSDNAIAAWSELDLAQVNIDIPQLGPDFDIELLAIENFGLDPADKHKTEAKQDGQLRCPSCGYTWTKAKVMKWLKGK